MHDNLSLVQRLLHRFSRREDVGEFFERTPPRLDEEEVDEDELEDVPEDEEEVVLRNRISHGGS
jgi:hypothetical protein